MRPNRKTWWIGAAGLATLALAVGAAPGNAAQRPTRGWDAPVLVSANEAARETSLAINAKNPNTLFVCDPSGVPAALSGGESYFHFSKDAGKHWKRMEIEPSNTDTRKYAYEGGDCDVAYDAGGTMYTADTWLGDLSVGASRDNGESWTGSSLSVTSPVVDRPWLVGGPAGTVYLSYHDLQCCSPSAMWFTKSTDYGKTFSPAVPITTANADGLYTWEGNFVVAPSGKDLYLVYSRRNSGAVSTPGLPGTEIIALAESHDGGTTWASRTITTIPRETSSIYPSIGMDAAGFLHVAWAAPRDKDNPVFYTMSKDHGQHWSPIKPLNPGKTGQAPWVAGGRAGEAAIVWLGSPVGKVDAESPWFFYWARVTNGKVTTGTTTTQPMWEGKQTAPEFEMVRLDKQGRMHIGMSVFVRNNTWAVYYQRESSAKR